MQTKLKINLADRGPHLALAAKQIISEQAQYFLDLENEYWHSGKHDISSIEDQLRFEKEYKETVKARIELLLRNRELADVQADIEKNNKLQGNRLAENVNGFLKRLLKNLQYGAAVPCATLTWKALPDGTPRWKLSSVCWKYPQNYVQYKTYDFGNIKDALSTEYHTVNLSPFDLLHLNPATAKQPVSDPLQNLNPPLDTPKARQMFQAFIDAKLVEPLPDGHLHWLTPGRTTKCPVTFVYFVTQASDYLGLTIHTADSSPRYSRKPFEDLFQIYHTSKKANTALSAKSRKPIEKIFENLSLK
ncbi:MAG: hypothetical protein K5867_10870 [Bacteroidales bacterium]|nr:hypothetical protein [Bacteroidales bacterium]